MDSPEPIRILHLEDNENDAALIERHLRAGAFSFTIRRVHTQAEFVGALSELEPSVVLSDNALSTFDASIALSLVRASRPHTPFILVSGTVGEERAVELLKSGATDYVLKDRLTRLAPAVSRALLEASDRGARERAERELRDNAQRLEQLADAMPQIVWAARPDGEIDYFNKRWYDYTGFAPHRASLDDWAQVLHPEDRESALNRYRAAVRSGGACETECRLRTRSGDDYRWHLCRIERVCDASDRVVRWFGTATDIDDRKRAEAELLRNAYYDRMTMLPNRALFEDRLAKALSASSRQQGPLLAVLFLDLDRFKVVNDSLGHAAGDRLLCAFARRLERLIRPCDTIARFGGDEFAVLLERLSAADQAQLVAQRILANLSDPFQLGDYEIAASASVGIVVSASSSDSTETLLRNADSAMYRAKSLGPGRCETFDAKMHAASLESLNLERDLRRALERNEFELHYQPICSLASGEITACEALVRWNHPTRGLLYPDAFIALAEEIGLIVPLGAWILRTACAQMQSWVLSGMRPFDLAVNCSARQFNQNALGGEVIRALQLSGFDPGRLKLELTESLLMESSSRVLGPLSELKALGVQLSIDDFGTGYSSLSYLRRLPCTSLKIDRSFVQDLNRNEEAAAITSAIISMAHSLKLKVIAEGIENEEQRSLLRDRDCDEGQGYLFSRPVPSAEFGRVMLGQTAPPAARSPAAR